LDQYHAQYEIEEQTHHTGLKSGDIRSLPGEKIDHEKYQKERNEAPVSQCHSEVRQNEVGEDKHANIKQRNIFTYFSHHKAIVVVNG
jgi:hypothetical protein